MNEDNLNNKDYHHSLTLFLLLTEIMFLMEGSAILLRLFKTYFSSFVLKRRQCIYSFFEHAAHWEQLLDYFSQTSFSHLFLVKIYSFLVLFIDKRLNLWYSLRTPFYFFVIYFNCCSVMKAFIIFIDRIYGCFFVLYRLGRICIWSTLI